ncbi:hypothetical protein [Capnocytophaga canimorsus]|uniref:Uncharacterized protein n=3 Tax=Capnocytophaga canimorsus TaxID=28188 RepID=F9YPL6_CAPCC|nr:hypothetical protein [Capnocytophaga canimorsus]AEK23362.1 Hypothetical protein Ccan_12460 [Capnocytophaga canimorsus Cc5]ATA93817.1 hypothetical protein CGC54_05420 [Capnocytophaga canimorsus]AWL77904.1 hypothetical protein DKB58_02495 [Capnocytophaga canimorsus]AYW36507.1 hypothetical protein D8L92_03745 [Capnocytophaga canimorsus]CEN47477.1 conserved hypothetical protein [Capnocytophaga canimorsus]
MDNQKVNAEMKNYQKIPQILSFVDEEGTDKMQEQIQTNYKQVKLDIVKLIKNELERIENDSNLTHLMRRKEIKREVWINFQYLSTH